MIELLIFQTNKIIRKIKIFIKITNIELYMVHFCKIFKSILTHNVIKKF